MSKTTTTFAVVAALALGVSACGGSDEPVDATDAAEVTEAPAGGTNEASATVEDADADSGTQQPGEGVTVTMARGDWSSGYFQAALYRALLQELGYEVSDPADLELAPSTFYIALAQGDADFWVNSWYPGHASWLTNELPDGSTVGDHVSAIGEEMVAGGLQGFLITASFADEFGVTSLDQLNDDPKIRAEFDKYDAKPGDGIAQIFGCQESYNCDDIIESQIAFSGWDKIEQTVAGYDAMVAQAVAQANKGEPMVIYTWTPSSYVTQLRPGDNVYWLAMDSILDDSNPLGIEGGENFAQHPGQAGIPPEQCPAAADAGTCQLGWITADIQVTANNEFLDANPAAKALFEQVKLSVIDVSEQTVAQDNGATPEELAQQWITDHRDLVDTWLEAARDAA